jgi:hypothetical protein
VGEVAPNDFQVLWGTIPARIRIADCKFVAGWREAPETERDAAAHFR